MTVYLLHEPPRRLFIKRHRLLQLQQKQRDATHSAEVIEARREEDPRTVGILSDETKRVTLLFGSEVTYASTALRARASMLELYTQI